MSVFRFPFNWGAPGSTATVSTTSSVATTRWTAVTAGTEPWRTQGAGQHRFERIYTQPVGTFGQSVNFNFQVQSQFPFIVQTANGPVLISSTITNP